MNNDLISRSELKHKFAQITYVRFTADMGQGGFEMFSEKEIEDIIDNAPSVDIKDQIAGAYNEGYACGSRENTKPQGKWIEHYSKEMSEKGYFLCSKCKCGFQRFERGIRHSDLPWIDGQKYELHCIDNFCPNCGAKMRGDEK